MPDQQSSKSKSKKEDKDDISSVSAIYTLSKAVVDLFIIEVEIETRDLATKHTPKIDKLLNEIYTRKRA